MTKGEPVIGGLHGAESHHYFCPHCMSWMFTRQRRPGLVRQCARDDARRSEQVHAVHRNLDERKAALGEHAAVHSFEALPPLEAFEGLIKGYAEQAPR